MEARMPDRVERWRPQRVKHTHTKKRAHYLTPDWRAKRERILIRDAFTCADCGRVTSGQAAHVDHIIPLEDGGTDADANLQTMCSSCHGRKTRREQRQRGLG
jgi:5-methylcytosine-specific restriction endonuclease McrA